MFAFIVPVKSAQLASDWEAFSRLFERTLKSICNQQNGDFKVIVACQEIPQIQFADERVEFVSVDFPPPSLVEDDWEKNRQLKEGDKANKILAGYKKALEYKPTYLMVVDADDLISNKIAGFALKNKQNAPGWYVKKGYYYREGARYLFINKKAFNKFCGTCIIIRSDLFPQLVQQEPFLYYNHYTMELAGGERLAPLPFAGALYSMGNGENHFMSVDHAKSIVKKPKLLSLNFIKSLYSKAMKYSVRPMTSGFKKSFGYYPVA